MKKQIILVLLLVVVILTACKKQTTTPDPEPVCQIGAHNFEGKWKNSLTGDTINIVFISDRCPVDNSNSYIIYGLKKALLLSMKPNMVFNDLDYHIYSDEVTKYSEENTHSFKVGLASDLNTMGFYSAKTISGTFFIRL